MQRHTLQTEKLVTRQSQTLYVKAKEERLLCTRKSHDQLSLSLHATDREAGDAAVAVFVRKSEGGAVVRVGAR
jgi:hypothetical protein